MKYYTAVGRYEFRKDANGLRHPVLMSNGKEYTPTVSEMAMWTMLLWHIFDDKTLKESFTQKRIDMHIYEDLSPEYYMVRLEKLGFIRSADGYTAADALYNLVAPLYLIPADSSFWIKFCTFFHLLIERRVPLKIARRVFHKEQLTRDEQTVLGLAAQNTLSTAELICCIDQNLEDVSDDQVIMDRVYSCAEINCENLPVYTKASTRIIPILEAITNLYLRRLILFEQC